MTSTPSVPLKVFIGVGSREEMQFGESLRMVANAKDLAARLRDHPSGADVNFIQFEGQNHGTVPAFFSQALEFVLPAPVAAVGH